MKNIGRDKWDETSKITRTNRAVSRFVSQDVLFKSFSTFFSVYENIQKGYR